MTERYYPGQWKALKHKHLSAEDQKKLDRFRVLQARWHNVFSSKDTSFLLYKSFLKQMRNFFDLPAMNYLYFQRDAHDELESKHANTFEGQLELAHKEATLFLNALEARSERVEKAFANKDRSPADRAEYDAACKDLEALKEDLKNTDLSQYREAIDWRMDMLYALGSSGPRDLRPMQRNDIWRQKS